MASLGMSAEQLIRAATADGADICRVRAGMIEEGRLGTILLFEVDPRLDVSRLTKLDFIVDRGRVLDRHSLDN